MLYIFGGLPGTGKSELSRYLAQEVNGIYLRIDTIEQAMRDAGITTIGPKGYLIAYNVAGDNLKLGLPVVADSVNPIAITRKAWRDVAIHEGVGFREIEVTCSDKDEHRRRVEERASEVRGLHLPTWEDVRTRAYERWQGDHIVIDTAGQSPEQSKKVLLSIFRDP